MAEFLSERQGAAREEEMIMSITCGKCSTFSTKIKHDSVAAVKACAMGTPVPVAAPMIVKINSLPPVPGAPVPAPVSVASEMIKKGANPEEMVPAGRYAITAGNGTVKFYVVDRPEDGKWKGYTFVSVQASDDLHRIRNRAERIGILAAIAVDPAEASRRYGRELGKCGVCNRTLTDPESIANGIGPVCAGRF